MKATMNQLGDIVIVPETEIEAYALRKWREENLIAGSDIAKAEDYCWRGSTLLIADHVPLETT